MRRKLIGLIAGLGMAVGASIAHAAQATLYIYQVANNANPSLATGGTYFVYAQDSTDNDGLAGYDLDVVGTNGIVINASTTWTLKAPHPNDGSGQYADSNGGNMGFNTQTSAGVVTSGTARTAITGGQNIAYGGADDPTYDMGLLVGVGQENSSASPQDGEQGPGGPTGISTPVWTYVAAGSQAQVLGTAGKTPAYSYVGTLLGQGTYTFTGGGNAQTADSSGAAQLTLQLHAGNFVGVLGTADNGDNEAWSPFNDGQSQVNLSGAAVTPDTITVYTPTPEPGSLCLLGAGLGFFGMGRNFRRKTA